MHVILKKYLRLEGTVVSYLERQIYRYGDGSNRLPIDLRSPRLAETPGWDKSLGEFLGEFGIRLEELLEVGGPLKLVFRIEDGNLRYNTGTGFNVQIKDVLHAAAKLLTE